MERAAPNMGDTIVVLLKGARYLVGFGETARNTEVLCHVHSRVALSSASNAFVLKDSEF